MPDNQQADRQSCRQTSRQAGMQKCRLIRRKIGAQLGRHADWNSGHNDG